MCAHAHFPQHLPKASRKSDTLVGNSPFCWNAGQEAERRAGVAEAALPRAPRGAAGNLLLLRAGQWRHQQRVLEARIYHAIEVSCY